MRGRVQGVGFRWFVTRHAYDLGVRGTVRNRADGAVEVVLQADESTAVLALLERIRRGPPASRVEIMECVPVDGGRLYEGFGVV